MDKDQQLADQLKEYQEIAKTNKNVDVATLMVSAMENHNRNMVSSKSKRWAYIVSVGAPPLGLLWALKYYLSDEVDAKEVANICLILTIISVIGFVIFTKLLFSGSGTSPSQIQQINPQDILELTQ